MCLRLYLLSEYQNSYSTSEVRTFWLVIATSKGFLRVMMWFQGLAEGLGDSCVVGWDQDLVFSCLFVLSFTDELLI